MPAGRPTIYNEDVADEICAWLAEGKSLISYAEQPNTPSIRAVFYWLTKYPEFQQKYILAREVQAHIMAERVYDESISVELEGDRTDNARVNLARLKQDGAKWSAERMLPKKYGPRATVEAGDNLQGTLSEMLAEVRAKRGGDGT